MSDLPPFLLDLWSTNGPVFAQLPEAEGRSPIYEWTTWLRIRSDVTGFVPPTIAPDDDELTGFVPPAFEDDGLAVMVTVRPQQDFPARSVGCFHDRLTADELEELRGAVEGLRWSELPRPVGGHVTAPSLRLRYVSGSRLIDRGFNARSTNFIAAIAPLWKLLDRRLSRLRKQPAGTLELELKVEGEGRERTILLGLRNHGLGAIAINDPRVPAGPGRAPALRVRIGALTGAAPSRWIDLPLPPPPEGGPPVLLVKARRRLSLRLPWVAPGPGPYLLRAAWEDYGGPLRPVPGQTPFMPVSERGPSALGSGPYPVRGASFAEQRVEVVEDTLQ